jgi:hypothetical protein
VKWTKEQDDLLIKHIGELLREGGLLWLVFSLLDRIVSDSFTFQWTFPNVAAALFVWCAGTYLDLRREVTR